MTVLEELTEQEYQAWKRHPVSELLFKFLADKSADYRQGFMDRWEADSIDPKEEAEFKHRIRICEELAVLKLSDIKTFYGKQGK